MSYLEENGIKAFCLDIDGTLYSRRQMNVRLALTAFPNLFLGLKFNSVRKAYRLSQDKFPPSQMNRKGLLKKQAILFFRKKNPSEKEIASMIKKIDRQFYKAWAKSFLSINAYKNMAETLSEAKQRGIKIAVLSDFPLENKLKILKIDHLVDFAISSEDTGFLKPAKQTFEALCQGINEKPENCLFFGDSYDKDVIGSKDFGMHSLYIDKKATKDKYPKADIICRNWHDVLNLVLR